MSSTSLPRSKSPPRHGTEADTCQDQPTHEQCEQLQRESEELCVLRQLKAAHGKATGALKMALQVYGKTSLRLVPLYLLLVDISLRDGQLKSAEELLSLINWLLIKDDNVKAENNTLARLSTETSVPALPEEMKSLFSIKMNKLHSLLHLEYGSYTEGLKCAAQGAYHSSLLFGPDHLYTSELYFCLGLLFYRMHRAAVRQEQAQARQQVQDSQRDQHQRNQQNDSTLAMLDKVVDIWYRFLTNPPEDTAAWMFEHQRLRIQEASTMLQQIVTMRQNLVGIKHVATGEALYTLGLLFLFLGEHGQAKSFIKQALDIYVNALGPDHPSTVDVVGVLRQLDEAGV